MNKFVFTLAQFILFIDSTKQTNPKQGIITAKTISKPIRNQFIKAIGNIIKKPVMRTIGNTIKNSVIKRSAEQIRGKGLGSLFYMVSKSKPQVPFLFAGAFMRQSQFNLVPSDRDGDYYKKQRKKKKKKDPVALEGGDLDPEKIAAMGEQHVEIRYIDHPLQDWVTRGSDMIDAKLKELGLEIKIPDKIVLSPEDYAKKVAKQKKDFNKNPYTIKLEDELWKKQNDRRNAERRRKFNAKYKDEIKEKRLADKEYFLKKQNMSAEEQAKLNEKELIGVEGQKFRDLGFKYGDNYSNKDEYEEMTPAMAEYYARDLKKFADRIGPEIAAFDMDAYKNQITKEDCCEKL